MHNVSTNVTSKITLKGVEVSGPFGREEVKISGDSVEATLGDSFIEGALKGIATAVVGPTYPYLASAFKAIGGHYEVTDAALEVGGDSRDAAKAGLKGALVGSLKGFAHGLLDFLAIGTLASVGGAIAGPIGVALGTIVGGGVYNVIKDAMRK
jgi:hypothetical protein